MGISDGTVLGTTKVIDHGADEDKWCLLITGDGFTSAEMSAFETAVDDHVTFLETHLTGTLNWEKANVIRLDVESDESGADNENGDGAFVDTYFNAIFGGATDRSLIVDSTLAIDTANAQFPEWDALLVLVNSTTYGGAALGGVAVASLDPSSTNELALHELGHAAFGLADEYSYLAGCDSGETTQNAYPSANGEPVEPNVTNAWFGSTLKWGAFVDPATPIPTTSNPDPTCATCDPSTASPVAIGTVGAFEGARYYHCNCWRPEFNCRMRDHTFGFCAVCSAHIGNVITLASLLDLSPCFVAGGVYGDRYHPDVIALQGWRDRHLEPGARGRTAMRLLVVGYGRVGPHLAAIVRRRPRFARLLRRYLLAPSAAAARRWDGPR